MGKNRKMNARDNDDGNDDDFEALQSSHEAISTQPNAKAKPLHSGSERNRERERRRERATAEAIKIEAFNHPIYNDCN